MRRRRRLVLAAALGVVVLVTGVVVLATADDRTDCGTFRFDADEWQSLRPWGNDPGAVATGTEVAGRLDGCRTLEGATRRAVKGLLGRPDRTTLAGREWAYDLGSPSGTSDYRVLVVEFGARGHVRGTGVVWVTS